MKVVDFYNEKGNSKVSVRNQMKEQVAEKLQAILGEEFDTVEVNSQKTISVQVAETAEGEAIYARMDFTISTKDPHETRKASKAKAEKPEVEEVDLFE